jgi:hypothetical protein
MIIKAVEMRTLRLIRICVIRQRSADIQDKSKIGNIAPDINEDWKITCR